MNNLYEEAFSFWYCSLVQQPDFLSYNNPHNIPNSEDTEGNWRYGWQAAMRYRDELEKERQE